MAPPKRMDFSKYPRETVARDDTLFFEEEQSKALYVLLTGSLGIFRNEVQVAVIDEPLSIIGEISALTGRPRNATVRALTQSNLVVIDKPDELFEEYPQMGSKLARLLANRLAGMDTKFVEIKGVLSKLALERHERQTASTVILTQDQIASAAMGLEEDDEEDSTMELALAISAREEEASGTEASGTEASSTEADVVTEPEIAIEADVPFAPEGSEVPSLVDDAGDPDSDPFAAAAAAPPNAVKTDPESREYDDEVFGILADILDWDPSIGT